MSTLIHTYQCTFQAVQYDAPKGWRWGACISCWKPCVAQLWTRTEAHMELVIADVRETLPALEFDDIELRVTADYAAALAGRISRTHNLNNAVRRIGSGKDAFTRYLLSENKP